MCRFSERPEAAISSAQASSSQATTPITSTRHATVNLSHASDLVVNEDDEEALVNQYGVEGAAAEEVLGYDEDEEDEEGDVTDCRDGGDGGSDFDFKAFQRQVRVDETRRAEGNRRAGGIKTQRAMVKAWEVGGLIVNHS